MHIVLFTTSEQTFQFSPRINNHFLRLLFLALAEAIGDVNVVCTLIDMIECG